MIEDLLDEAIKLAGKKFAEIEEEKITIFGDIHGDYSTMKKLMKDAHGFFIFLGDYEDRGREALEVYEEVLKLYVEGKAVMLKGNHETGEAFPHDFPALLEEKGVGELYSLFKRLWEKLPLFAVAGDLFLCHGGLATNSCRGVVSFSELKRNPEKYETEILWNDPMERRGCEFNYDRGIGYYFGRDLTRTFCEDEGFSCVIRSHQPYKVLLVEQDGYLITLGSTAIPYGLSSAAILRINLSESYKDGNDIVRKFGIVREVW